MGYAERLVQIDVADIGAIVARARQSHLRVQVRAVEIDLPAVAVDDVADRAHLLLEHAMGRRIRDHDRGQAIAVRVGLGSEIGQIHVSAAVASHHHDFHTCHVR